MTTLTAALLDELGRDEPTGLLGRMLYVYAHALETGQTPAQLVGTTPATWNRWMTGARGGNGTRPSPASQRKIHRAVRKASAARWRERDPHDVTIRAKIRWNGYYNTTKVRTTRLTGLILDHMIDAYGQGSSDATVVTRFLAAVKDRHGVPVRFDNVQSLTIR